MGKERLVAVLAPVFEALKGAEPNDGPKLAERLNREFPPTHESIRAVHEVAAAGVTEGWLCDREAGGIRFSRPVKPSDASAGYSVDAVVMDRVAGPKHTHTNGEINL